MNVKDCDELKRGKYIALIHVTGIYMGAHGTTGKLASLQMKVIQLVYEPMPIDKCFIVFDASDFKDQDSDGKEGTSEGAMECDEADKTVKTRTNGESSAKRPKLKRQEAHTNLQDHFNPFISEDTQHN